MPVLRSGQAMLDAALTICPESVPAYHLGLFRDPSSLQPIEYYNKLPGSLSAKSIQVFVLDPLLATGGTIISAVEAVMASGVAEKNITIVCVLATVEGIRKVTQRFSDLTIIVATGDQDHVSEKGLAYPGFGDVGDRLFGN